CDRAANVTECVAMGASQGQATLQIFYSEVGRRQCYSVVESRRLHKYAPFVRHGLLHASAPVAKPAVLAAGEAKESAAIRQRSRETSRCCADEQSDNSARSQELPPDEARECAQVLYDAFWRTGDSRDLFLAILQTGNDDRWKTCQPESRGRRAR